MKPATHWLCLAICSVFVVGIIPAVAHAEDGGEPCSDIRMLQHKCGQQQTTKKQATKAAPKSNYPNATRKQPTTPTISAKEGKTLDAGIAALNSGDTATALKDLQPIADGSSNAYAKALAMLALAQNKYNSGDTKGAIALQKQALALNSLDNNSYFQGLLSLAQMYIGDEDYPDALTTLNTWQTEGRAENASAYALEGNAYYRLQKYPEAVAAIKKAKTLTTKSEPSWDQIEMASYFAMGKYDDAATLAETALAKDPNNSTLLQNVIAIYINAGQTQKALALLNRAHANGQIKDEAGYVNMAKIYDNLAQNGNDTKADARKAVAILKEGMDKGIVKPSYDTYKLLGDSYGIAGDYPNAVTAYGKAAPGAKTGEIDFLRGQMLANLDHNTEARDALKQAIAKGGFKRMGAAYLTLGNTELALKNKSAAIAAYRQAENDPETRADARRTLKQMGQK